jgi:predicted DNA-binding ArsR family transcriptional regulator
MHVSNLLYSCSPHQAPDDKIKECSDKMEQFINNYKTASKHVRASANTKPAPVKAAVKAGSA